MERLSYICPVVIDVFCCRKSKFGAKPARQLLRKNGPPPAPTDLLAPPSSTFLRNPIVSRQFVGAAEAHGRKDKYGLLPGRA